MPVYEYRCPNGHQTEEVCKAGDAPAVVDCDHARCQQRASRVFTTPMMPLMNCQTRKRRKNPGDDLPVTSR